MKKSLLGKILVLVATTLLIAGCGHEEEMPLPGADWRTTGSYVYGTLEHGESMSVLVGIGSDKLTIFYDAPTKEAYMSVDYPYETTDMQTTVDSLVIEDLNEDGYTDLMITICDQQGEQYAVEFLWDMDSNTFNCIAPNPDEEGDFTFSNFMGAWTNESEKVSIVIDENKNWAFIADETPNAVGNTVINYGVVELYTSEGTYYCTLTYIDNTLVDEYENVYVYAGPAEVLIPNGIVELAE